MTHEAEDNQGCKKIAVHGENHGAREFVIFLEPKDNANKCLETKNLIKEKTEMQ